MIPNCTERASVGFHCLARAMVLRGSLERSRRWIPAVIARIRGVNSVVGARREVMVDIEGRKIRAGRMDDMTERFHCCKGVGHCLGLRGPDTCYC